MKKHVEAKHDPTSIEDLNEDELIQLRYFEGKVSEFKKTMHVQLSNLKSELDVYDENSENIKISNMLDNYNLNFAMKQKLFDLSNSLSNEEFPSLKVLDRKTFHKNLFELHEKIVAIQAGQERQMNFLNDLANIIQYLNNRLQKRDVKDRGTQVCLATDPNESIKFIKTKERYL